MKIRFFTLAHRLRTLSLLTAGAFGLLVGGGGATWAGGDSKTLGALLRYPDVSRAQIVFLYANNLWTVSRNGGLASPLASPRGVEGFPRFSSDGQTVAFVGNYDGNSDIYTIPTAGGIPQRVTYHPAFERLCDWTPDGQLLFASNGTSSLRRIAQLKTVSPEGGMPEVLPIPYGAAGAIHADGEWLAYTPNSRDFRTWKRYMGGLADDIWLFNLKTLESKRVTDWPGTDTNPMWHGDTLYYLSDAGPNSRLNIWKYDSVSGERAQITEYADFDVKFPSMGPGLRGRGEIVFQYGAELMLLDLANNNTTVVKVILPGGRPTLRAQVHDAAKLIQGAGISPTGKRAVVEARGDIWTLPAEKGLPRNLTNTNGAAERSPAWSPDGRWIAYWSDAVGDEYQLFMTQSDGKGETIQLTTDLNAWLWEIWWSPNSEMILFTDKTGAIRLLELETKEVELIDTEPGAFSSTGRSFSWSHDSRFITYARVADDTNTPSIWIYRLDEKELRQVTAGVFPDRNPVFDRKGDYLYFASSRTFSPTYSDLDTTFIYEDSGNILAVPLRAEMDYVWTPETDEESWEDADATDDADDADDDAAADDQAGDGEDADAADDADDEDGEGDDTDDAEGVVDDGISGTWDGTAEVPDQGEMPISFSLTLGADNEVSGNLEAGPFSGPVTGSWEPDAGKLFLTLTIADGMLVTFDLKIEGSTMTGSATAADVPSSTISCTRTSIGGAAAEEGEGDDEGNDKDEETKKVEIDFEDFEARAILLPVGRGNFGSLAVNNKNQLLFADRSKGIRLFDLKDDKKAAKEVQAGVRRFGISADGKKLIYGSGRGINLRGSGTGGSAKRVKTAPMDVRVDPRVEWHQLFRDVYRIYRDFFYDKDLHGVDWKGMAQHYARLVDDCTTREEVSYVMGELIAELNVGHAYMYGGGPGRDSVPSKSVGMLGCDFELEKDANAFRIARIYAGAAWDADARGPLSQPGVKVKEGDYLLAVNNLPLDPARDPWSAFINLSGETVVLTVSDQPTLDAAEADQREVIVKTISSERNLRYRAWIEKNRRYVDEMTDGRVGYLHVPDTGRNGQNNLVRQLIGLLEKDALIIDERWNGGGQIPTRFIEMLNRPVVNYWAVQDGRDWKWPPDSHQGPKCMLINGPSGSGGDAFPHYFRQVGLGKLIGTRTWGGLVGISGNPRLIDGGYVSVPTFGFYENDGTWGIEGFGVAPDIEVIEDPAKMQDGKDPQLDAAITLMLEELKTNAYQKPARPPGPDRSGMRSDGIPREER